MINRLWHALAVRTADGGISVTVRRDKAGADQSLRVAGDWKHASNLNAPSRAVSEGTVILQLSQESGTVAWRQRRLRPRATTNGPLLIQAPS